VSAGGTGMAATAGPAPEARASGKRRISEPEGRGAAWTEERATKERATREGGASGAPRRRAGEHSQPEGQDAPEPSGQRSPARVSFQTAPDRYRHWRIAFDGPVATLTMDVAEDNGLRGGYELKLNSYDLGVDIELYDAVQRLRFEHPEVRAV